MWFTFSLITALAWGGSDLFSKMGTNPKDKFSHWRMVIMVGFVMGIHAVGYMVIKQVDYNPINMLKYLPVSAMYILSMTLGYAGLRYIELSVSSPICNSSGAVTSLLCFFVLGQKMTGIQFVAIALICVGIVLLSVFEKKKDHAERLKSNEKTDKKYRVGFVAILFPILYCIIDGLGSFGDAIVLDEGGYLSEIDANLSYEFTFLICAVLALFYITVIKKQKFNPWKERTKGLAALCETGGQFTYVFAMADNAIVAAPMIASYSIFSVLLSRIILKEKLNWKQYCVIGIVMCGIAILGME